MSSKVEPPSSPMQQSGKHCCPGPFVLLLHSRAWRSHGLACPGISSLVSHRCARPVSALTEAAVMRTVTPAVAGTRCPCPKRGDTNPPPAAQCQGLCCPRCPCPPCMGIPLCHQLPHHLLQQDSSWEPPGNICFRLDTHSVSQGLIAPRGQPAGRMLALPCLFSGFPSG